LVLLSFSFGLNLLHDQLNTMMATNGDLGQASNSNRRLQQTQAQVDEVVGIMKTNVEKVLERDQKLSELDDRATVLQEGASQFEVHAGKLKRKYWWKNLKMMLILGGIGAVILIVVIVSVSTGSG